MIYNKSCVCKSGIGWAIIVKLSIIVKYVLIIVKYVLIVCTSSKADHLVNMEVNFIVILSDAYMGVDVCVFLT